MSRVADTGDFNRPSMNAASGHSSGREDGKCSCANARLLASRTNSLKLRWRSINRRVALALDKSEKSFTLRLELASRSESSPFKELADGLVASDLEEIGRAHV